MMKDRPQDERPRERLLRNGGEALTLRELIAVLLGVGPAGQGCLGVASNLLSRLGQVDAAAEEAAFFLALEEGDAALSAVPGLGPAGRARLLAAAELARRYIRARSAPHDGDGDRPSSVRLSDIERRALAKIPRDLALAASEWLGFVPVAVNGSAGSFNLVARGSRSSVAVDVQELFARVLAVRPLAICLFHNHPSGNLQASDHDVTLTRRCAELCDQLGITFLGHWIVTPRSCRRIDAVTP
jgi:DNA repair protein RadC